MDEVVVNANQLENSVQSTASCLWHSTLPFAVDPVLWRFQVPAWWRNAKGETKRNYARLGRAYCAETSIDIGTAPLVEAVHSDDDWRRLAANAIEYQRDRLLGVPTQLDLLDAPPRELRPTRLIAPALVAYSSAEDRINRLLAEASADTVGGAVAAQVIVPPGRLVDSASRKELLDTIPTGGMSLYLVWTPEVSEELLIGDHELMVALVRLIRTLAERGIPVGHQYGNYAIAALHDAGLMAITHHLSWVDHGEPAKEQQFMFRSCQTYAPGVRRPLRFGAAEAVGRPLAPSEYGRLFCGCTFCTGAFAAGQHPLDLLLEDQLITLSNGQQRRIPTSRAVGANTWHYLISRHLEAQAFSEKPSAEVLERDMQRAVELAGKHDGERLRRLAEELRIA